MSNEKPTGAPNGTEWHILEKSVQYDADAWRDVIDASRARIDDVRRRDVTIRLVDRAGRPLAGRAVRAVQTESDFLWGFGGWGLMNQLRSGAMATDGPKRHARYMAELFNSVNLLHYWVEKVCTDAPVSEEFQGFSDYENLQASVDWALANGLTPKGHPLFWPVDKAIPDWVHKYDYKTKMKFLEVRIRTITSRFKGKIKLYDAINEMIWEPSFAKTAERHWPHMTPVDEMIAYIEPILRWAREEDPDARYLINDYGVHVGHMEEIPVPTNDGRYINRDYQARRYQELLLALVNAGAPPDAVGIQGFFGGWGNHDKDIATLDLLGTDTGLPVHITEFQSGGKQAQDMIAAGVPRDEVIEQIANYVENALITAFGHPSVEAFYFWYDMEYLFNQKGRPTLWYTRLHDLIHRQWRTDEALTTDAQGVVRFRGFCGDYSLRLPQPNSPHIRVATFRVAQATRGALEMEIAL
jgi:GH35 family endo-1,4-beta-xylanase